MDIPFHKRPLIEELFAEYQQRPFTKSGDFRDAARLYEAVPVFEGWTEVVFLKTDGSFFALDIESGTGPSVLKWTMSGNWRRLLMLRS